MRDIPMFTTSHGAASLTLQEIPSRQRAYIRLQASQEPQLLLEDCIGFCRACGAERIYASGDGCLEQYPLHTAVWKMIGQADLLPQTDAALFPVQEETASQWRTLYNEAMKDVDNASYLSEGEAKRMARDGEAYFIHRGDTLLGIGSICGENLTSVAATVPGSGAELVAALAGAMMTERVVLEVASTNEKALRLYRKLGFLTVAECSRWYQVF